MQIRLRLMMSAKMSAAATQMAKQVSTPSQVPSISRYVLELVLNAIWATV